jgi:HlyD family secretion protein
MKSLRKILIFLIFAAILIGAGYIYYRAQYLPAQAAPVEEIQTARVRKGDIRITASGGGNLVPATEINLGFRNSGVLTELNVGIGDRVEAGQVLARLDDTSARIQLEQARLNLETLTSPYAIAEAEKALADALSALEEAEYARLSQQEGYRGSASTIDAVKADLILAEAKVEKTRDKYEPLANRPEDDLERATALAQFSAAGEARDAILRQLNWYLGVPDDLDQASLDAEVAIAQTRVAAAEALLAELKGETQSREGGVAVNPDLNQLRQAKLSLENAQSALDSSVLYAPIDGNVTAVNAALGEIVNANPIIEIAALDQPVVRFYLEENDLGKVAVGTRAVFTFDAYPEQTLEGEVYRLEPVLATVDGTPVVVAWATINAQEGLVLLSGMAAEVEVIAGESKETLLVPVQALRELSPGSYAVFLVQPDGQLELTPVTVGLKDFANAEILTGLKAGDLVSTGTVETK